MVKDNIARRDSQKLYISDEEVYNEQKRARRLTQKRNTMDRSDFEGIAAVLKELMRSDKDFFINPPFYCDYGDHIIIGDHTWINYNCTILDVGKVRIGERCLFGPNVAIYSAGHPVHPAARNSHYEYGIDVSIGDNCWIGGNSVINGGVTIGDCCVIGAGSVVTKDIPAWSIAVGNPARVVRKITEADRKYYFRDWEIDPEAWEDMQRMWKETPDDPAFPTAPDAE